MRVRSTNPPPSSPRGPGSKRPAGVLGNDRKEVVRPYWAHSHRAIKLIKNAASERLAARELGKISNKAGHAFEEFAARWLFPNARREVAAGERVIDLIWKEFLIELKTSRELDARGREQLVEFAKAAKESGLGLRYVFLSKPAQATIRLIEEAGGKVLYLFE